MRERWVRYVLGVLLFSRPRCMGSSAMSWRISGNPGSSLSSVSPPCHRPNGSTRATGPRVGLGNSRVGLIPACWVSLRWWDSREFHSVKHSVSPCHSALPPLHTGEQGMRHAACGGVFFRMSESPQRMGGCATSTSSGSPPPHRGRIKDRPDQVDRSTQSIPTGDSHVSPVLQPRSRGCLRAGRREGGTELQALWDAVDAGNTSAIRASLVEILSGWRPWLLETRQQEKEERSNIVCY